MGRLTLIESSVAESGAGRDLEQWYPAHHPQCYR